MTIRSFLVVTDGDDVDSTIIYRDHADTAAGSDRTADGLTIPVLTVHRHFAVWREVTDSSPNLTDHALISGHRPLPVRVQDAREQEHGEDSYHDCGWQDHTHAHSQGWNRSIEEHQRAEHKGDHTAHRQQPIAGHLHLQYEEHQSDEDQRHARPAHR